MARILILIAALGAALILSSAPASAEADQTVKQFTVNEFTVYSLLDLNNSMKIGLFSGPLSRQQRLAYLPDGQAPSSVNVYLIKSPAGKNILVDAGWGGSGPGRTALPERLKAVGLSPDDIDLIIMTHLHPDHIGGLLKGSAPAFAKARVLVSRPELEYWRGRAETAAEPAEADPQKPVAPADLPGAVIRAYGPRLTVFEFDQAVSPGLTALNAVGHTPGHTAFLLESGERRLLFIGDLVHAAALQFPEPEECASYDQVPAQAVASRKLILKTAAEQGLPVAGAHIPFPGLGQVRANEKNGFVFTPVSGDLQ